MKVIVILAHLSTLILSQSETIPLSYNFDCQYYQDSIKQFQDPFSINFQNDQSKYYSQAPEGQSLGKCNVIPCIGSPVFIIDKAHTYINDQFDIANQMSSAKLIGFSIDTKGSAYNVTTYKIVFELANSFGQKYIGVQVDSPIQGFGSAKYQKLIFNSDLNLVLEIIGLSRSAIKEYQCGDHKLYYSYYNRGDSSQLPYQYAGKNFNIVNEQVQDEIAKAQTNSKGRQCNDSNYQRIYDAKSKNFFKDNTELITPPLRENFYCNNKGLNVDRIRLSCRVIGNYEPDNFEAFQLVTKDKDGSLIYNPIQGDAGTNSRYFKDISLAGATEVGIEFWGADQQDPDLNIVREEIRIVTYDARGKVIEEIRCGDYFDHHRQSEVRISAQDFMGFWYNFDGERNIQRLGVIAYKN